MENKHGRAKRENIFQHKYDFAIKKTDFKFGAVCRDFYDYHSSKQMGKIQRLLNLNNNLATSCVLQFVSLISGPLSCVKDKIGQSESIIRTSIIRTIRLSGLFSLVPIFS